MTTLPSIGDRVKSRDGFEGEVIGFGQHAGQATVIVEGKGGQVHTFQPAVLAEPKAAAPKSKAVAGEPEKVEQPGPPKSADKGK